MKYFFIEPTNHRQNKLHKYSLYGTLFSCLYGIILMTKNDKDQSTWKNYKNKKIVILNWNQQLETSNCEYEGNLFVGWIWCAKHILFEN